MPREFLSPKSHPTAHLHLPPTPTSSTTSAAKMGRPKPPTFDYTPTTLPMDHLLVHLGPPQGSNNFTSVDPSGTPRLVELSSKLRTRGAVLVARGDFAFVKLFPADPKGGEERLVGEIIQVLSAKEVRDFKRSGGWPAGFGDPEPVAPVTPTSEGEGYETDEEDEGEDEGRRVRRDDDEDEDSPPVQRESSTSA